MSASIRKDDPSLDVLGRVAQRQLLDAARRAQLGEKLSEGQRVTITWILQSDDVPRTDAELSSELLRALDEV